MYLQTDEETESAEALAQALMMARKLDENINNWRSWVITALHTATQGFMVLSLRHGNGLLALSTKSYREWMQAYEALLSKKSKYFENVDVIYSEEQLREGHEYEIVVNRDSQNPRIIRVLRELS